MRPDQGIAFKYVSNWRFRSNALTTWHTLVKFNPTLSPAFELDFSDLLRTHLKVNAIACDLRSHHPDIGGHKHLRTHTKDNIKWKNVTFFQGPFVAFQTSYFKQGPGEIGYINRQDMHIFGASLIFKKYLAKCIWKYTFTRDWRKVKHMQKYVF